MAIKPIDYQVMVPKTSEIAKTVNDEHHKNINLQQNQSSALQNKAESDVRTVHSQSKASEGKIREKNEKDKKQGGKKNKKNDKDQNGSVIDVRL